MKRVRITTAFLVLLNAALAASVVLLWIRGQQRVSEPDHLNIPPLSLPDLAALNSVQMASVDVNTIRDQSAFYTNRVFYRPPAVSVEVAAPDYEMAGTLGLAPGKRVAFVKKRADHTSKTLHVGDDLEGWRVTAIEPDRVILVLNEQMAELRNGAGGGIASGLIRGPTAPHIAQTGIRVLGTTGATQLGSTTGSHDARIYRPPPSQDK
jgi:hypothetical protein